MWTETKTNDQFSSNGWIIKSSQIFCLRKDTCSKPKPRQNCIGQLDRAQSAVTCHTNDVIQDVTEKYWMIHPVLSDVWLSTKGVFIATQLNSTEINSTAWTTVDSVCRSWRHKQKHDWLVRCSTGSVEFSWVVSLWTVTRVTNTEWLIQYFSVAS